MGCSNSKILERNPIKNPKSTEQEAKVKKLDENKTKDAETPNERNKKNITDSKSISDMKEKEKEQIKENKNNAEPLNN
jgi:hypothetical protein